MSDPDAVKLSLSKEEIELYDRQIRLWGISAQQRIRASKVLLYNLGGCGTEITKNLVLSGVGSLTIYDSHLLSEDDLFNQFFISKDDELDVPRLQHAKPRIQDMNPRVEVNCVSSTNLLNDLDAIKNYDMVIVTECNDAQTIEAINNTSREFKIPFYLCGGNGLYGYCFIDLIEFISTDEKLKNGNIRTRPGKLSENKEILEVVERTDEEDHGKVYEVIRTKNIYKPFCDMLKFDPLTLSQQMTKRQLRKITNALPLTLANFNAKGTNISAATAQQVAQELGLPVSDSYNLSADFIATFNRMKNIEYPPVNAIIGGAVAQDVINVLGKQESPLNNFLVFDSNTLEMPILEL
ncbi:hypothetical protein ACO0RG_000017 [Hanseniaspora osmophila]